MDKVIKSFQLCYPLVQKRVGNVGDGPQIISETVAELDVWVKGTFDPTANPMDTAERYKVDLDSIRHKGSEISDIVDFFEHREIIEQAATRAFAKIMDHEAKKEGTYHE